MKIKGIKYIAPVLDNSGYAQAARGNIIALYKAGIPVKVQPISFESARPDLGKEGEILQSLINKTILYNVVIVHTTPEFWHKYVEKGKTNVGYTIWETSKLHPDWPGYINKNVDKVLVGCEWNKEVFEGSGVSIPVGVVPHVVNTDVLNTVESYKLGGISDDTYTFYNIQQWTERKHPIALLKAYWHAFQAGEDVALVLKTYRSDYSDEEKNAIRTSIRRLKQMTPMDNYPPVYLITDMLSNDEIVGLHKRGDCYISTDRGEGFGLSPFLAGACGNPLIITGFGGSTEYAKEDNSYLINYSLTPVSGMPWSSSIKSIVYTDLGFKNINNVVCGDRVFNKKGNLKGVIRVGSRKLRQDEVMYSLKYMSMYEGLEVTNYHELYIVDGNNIVRRRVGEINEGDYLVVPKPPLFELENTVIDISSYVNLDLFIIEDDRLKCNNTNSYWVNRYVSVNEDLAYLIGLYLSEGCVYTNSNTVSFSFSSDEIDTVVERCISLINSVFGVSRDNINLREYKDRDGCEITITSNPVYEFFKQEFCSAANKKILPIKFGLSSDIKFRRAILESYWIGDGHVRKFRIVKNKKFFNRECTATSASRDLILSIRSLIMSFGVLPSLTKNVRKDGRVSYILSVNHPFMDKIIGIPMRSAEKSNYHYYLLDDNNFAVRLKKKEELYDFNEDIWSISVENDIDEEVGKGSYILNGIASSNSPWYRGDQLWAEPDVKHTADLMRHVYENQDEAKETGNKVQNYINTNFTYEVIGEKLSKEIEEL